MLPLLWPLPPDAWWCAADWEWRPACCAARNRPGGPDHSHCRPQVRVGVTTDLRAVQHPAVWVGVLDWTSGRSGISHPGAAGTAAPTATCARCCASSWCTTTPSSTTATASRTWATTSWPSARCSRADTSRLSAAASGWARSPMSSRWGLVADLQTCLVVLQPRRLCGGIASSPRADAQCRASAHQLASGNRMYTWHPATEQTLTRTARHIRCAAHRFMHAVTQNRCAARTARCWR